MKFNWSNNFITAKRRRLGFRQKHNKSDRNDIQCFPIDKLSGFVVKSPVRTKIRDDAITYPFHRHTYFRCFSQNKEGCKSQNGNMSSGILMLKTSCKFAATQAARCTSLTIVRNVRCSTTRHDLNKQPAARSRTSLPCNACVTEQTYFCNWDSDLSCVSLALKLEFKWGNFTLIVLIYHYLK